ncbi:MAG TPA: hypothetical protein VGP82_08760 [Ktedonobacterales bacterium]|nr:hypothetical protein [Ktedonobacterales bacterium]
MVPSANVNVAQDATPRSMPVSPPVSGRGGVGTAAQEQQAYQPSAALERVTVLGLPANGRDHRRASRPSLESPRKPWARGAAGQSAPVPKGV